MAECQFNEWSTEHPFRIDCREHGQHAALCSLGKAGLETQVRLLVACAEKDEERIKELEVQRDDLESHLRESEAACAKMRKALQDQGPAWKHSHAQTELCNICRAFSSDSGQDFLADHDRLAERVKKAETKSQEKMSTMIESTSLDRAYVDGWNSAMEAIQETLAEAEETR